MEVLLMVGMYAGEIRDIRADRAQEMLRRGEALDPNQPRTRKVTPPEIPSALSEPEIDAAATMPRPRHRRRA